MNRAHTVVPRIEVLVDRTQLNPCQTKFEMTSFRFLISIGEMGIDLQESDKRLAMLLNKIRRSFLTDENSQL